jgi:hypothetical protein
LHFELNFKFIMKTTLRFLLAGIFVVAIGLCANAQTDPPPDPDEIPLDPGSWVLVAAGVGYGVKKWKDSKRRTEESRVNTTADFLQDERVKQK